MLWWQHLFAVWLLGHMLWACILLQREWQRQRDSNPDPVRGRPQRSYLKRESRLKTNRRYGALVLQARQVPFFGHAARAGRPANDNFSRDLGKRIAD